MSDDGTRKMKQKKVNFSGKPYDRSQTKSQEDNSFLGKVKGTIKSLFSPSWMLAGKTSAAPVSAPSGALLEQLTAPPLNAGQGSLYSTTPIRPTDDVAPHPYQISQRFVSPAPVQQPAPGSVPYLTHITGQRTVNSLGTYRPLVTRPPEIRLDKAEGDDDDVIQPDPAPPDSGRTLHTAPSDGHQAPHDGRKSLHIAPTDGHQSSHLLPEKTAGHVDDTDGGIEESLASFFKCSATDKLLDGVYPPRGSAATPHPVKEVRNKALSQPRIPQFNIGLFSNSRLSDTTSSLFGAEPMQSPFYSGKTSYGGAGAQRRTSRLVPGEPSSKNVSVQRMAAKTSPNNISGTVTSSTARKILDTLDSMSSIVGDAKKIPLNSSSMMDSTAPYTPRSYGRSTSLRRSGTPSAPPIGRLSTPGVASIARNRQTTNLRETDETRTRQALRMYSQPASMDTPVLPRSGKMRREKSGLHYKSGREEEEEQEFECPELPQPSFQLPVPTSFNLEAFSPVASKTPKAFISRAVSTAGPSSSLESVRASFSASTSPFTFSRPTVNTPPAVAASESVNQGFEFSSPVAISDEDGSKSRDGNAPVNGPILAGTSSSLSQSPFQFDVSKAKVRAGSGSTPGPSVPIQSVTSFASPVLKAGSVLDALGKDTASESKTAVTSSKSGDITFNNNWAEKYKLKPGQWACPECMINNPADKSQCLACNTPNPVEKRSSCTSATDWKCKSCTQSNSDKTCNCSKCGKSKQGQIVINDASLLERFKPPAGSWECQCMLMNTGDTCPSCGASKPSAKTATTTTNALPKQISKPLLTSNLGSNWECDVCWSPNSVTSSQCAACTAPNPKKSAPPAPATINMDKFKKTSEEWECDTCLVVNKNTAVKCIACETSKPGASVTSQFSKPGTTGFQFGSVSSSGGFVMPGSDKASSKPSGGFSFGQKNDSTVQGIKLYAPSTGFNPTGFSTPVPSGGGFKFTGDKTSDTTQTNGPNLSSSGGFKFESNNASAGLQFGAKNESKNEKPGFTLPPLVKSDSVRKYDISTTSSGFTFNTPSSESSNNELPTTDSITSVFKFGPVTNGPKSVEPAPAAKPSPAAGGFSFVAPASSAPSATSTFTFGSSAKTSVASAALSSTPSFTASPASTNSFSFGTTTSTSNSAGFGAVSSSGSITTGIVAGTKRKQETDEPAAKRAFGNNAASFAFSANPAVTSSAPASTANAGIFTFGSQAAKTAVSALPEAPAPAKPGFAFGGTAATPVVQNNTSSTAGGFSFAAAGSAVPPENKATPPSFGSSSPAPTFGGTTNNAFGSSVFGGATSNAPSAFGQTNSNVFGQANASAAPAPFGSAGTAPSFGAPAAKATPSFGASPAPAFGSNTNNSSSSGFNFQGVAQPASSGGFNFGQAANTASPAVFQFGSQPSATPGSSSQATPAGFNFTAGATATPSPGAPYMFSGSNPSATAQNPFNASKPPGMAGRKIKKATRKLR